MAWLAHSASADDAGDAGDKAGAGERRTEAVSTNGEWTVRALQAVDLGGFDLRLLDVDFVFAQTGYPDSIRYRAQVRVRTALAAARARVPGITVRPETGRGPSASEIRVFRAHLSRAMDAEMKLQTSDFLRNDLSIAQLRRLGQVWLKIVGPNTEVLQALGLSEEGLQRANASLFTVRERARAGPNNEAILRAGAAGIRETMPNLLNERQLARWRELIGEEPNGSGKPAAEKADN